MKILVTGATGFVGQRLLEKLMLEGFDDIRVLSRSKIKANQAIPIPVEVYEWDITNKTIEKDALKDVDIVIHLAGESVAEGRWTDTKKQKILNSRVNGTSLLIEEIKKLKTPPKKFISTSAIGIYGNRADEDVDENSDKGSGFLSDVCHQWEGLALEHGIEGMTTSVIRVGIVLGPNGGALSKMLLPFKLGAGGKLGSGNQYMSWIHIDDLVDQYIYLLKSESSSCVYNGTAPRPVTNLLFTKILGKVLSRPTILPAPGFAIKLAFGEMSQILLEGQKVLPKRFIEEGFNFKFQGLEEALLDILKRDKKGEDELKKYQWVERTPSEVFPFFSNEKNLERITPPFLKFKVKNISTEKIETGTIINYTLSLRGIPMNWKSKIEDFKANTSFIDTQVIGPYSKWEHTHEFIPFKSGTLIRDYIIYKIPLGFIGRLFAGRIIRGDLGRIFSYRQKVIGEIFPKKELANE